MQNLLKSLAALSGSAALGAATAFAAPAADLPGDLKTGELLYESSLAEAESVRSWRMEGPGETDFKDGWMHMQSPGEKMHHVFWCPERFPESFVAQWQVRNHNVDAGLLIVFFAAAGEDDDQSIFHEDLPERDGDFKQYTRRGHLRSYHISYYANAAHNPDRQQTNLRKNDGFHLVSEGPEGIPTQSEEVHTITLAKQGPHIRLWVDDKKVIDWTDKGKQGGEPHGDGFIGLRQMKWSHFAYRNFRVWGLPENDRAAAAAWDNAPHALPRIDNVDIDGAAADWADRGLHVRLYRPAAKGRWEETDHAAVRLGWDNTGLLALVRVQDDKWVEADKDNMLWKLDGVELYMATEPGSPQYYQVVISPGMTENHPELRSTMYDKRYSKEGKLAAEIARSGRGEECIIEARLPWSNLGMTPAEGVECGVQVMINDHDADGKDYADTAHSLWYKALGTAQDPGKMHAVRLANADGKSAAANSHLGWKNGERLVLSVRAAPSLAGETVVVLKEGRDTARAELTLSEDRTAASMTYALPVGAAEDKPVYTALLDGVAIGRHDVAAVSDRETRQLITKAGNAESEQERYRILSELTERKDLPDGLRHNLDTLLPVVDWWANGKEKLIKGTGGRAAENGYLCRFFYRQAKPGNDWPGKVDKNSHLYPLGAYYRARALVWEPIQVWGRFQDPNKRERWFGEARKLFEIAAEAYPENDIIAMYNGEAMSWPADFDPDPNAPEWANLQREGYEKLADVIHWWIDNRQVEDGQFGGGWGDDVEMWRWWTPILVAFDDPAIIKAQTQLSRAILDEPHMKHGYTSNMSDVEHTAEDTGDSITPMLFLEPDNPEWHERAARIVDIADKAWMAKNQRGFLQFKSTYFNVHKVDTQPKRACDTVYHPRTFHPSLIHWLRTGDEVVGDLISRWMDTWIDATAREENGKPAGITPSAIHWPDGEVGGGVKPWWKPQNYSNDLFAWPSAMSLMTRTMLLTYHMTGDEKYLQPIKSMAEIRRKYLNNPPDGKLEPGSAAWCALEGHSRFGGNGMVRFLPETLAKYRLLTGDPEFDDLLRKDAGGYVQMRLGDGRDALVTDLKQNAKAFRINKPAYTNEMRWTDRVLVFNSRWGNQANGWHWPTPDTGILYASATGDPGDPRYFPMNAVRWLIEPRAFAALVTESGQHGFAAELYNFRDTDREVPAELYLLGEGKYSLTLTDKDGRKLQSDQVKVTGTRTRITLSLPPGTLCKLTVQPN